MPTECTSNPLQRELADSIIRYSPVDELRILIACGAKPDEPVTQGLRPLHYAVWQRYVEAVQFLLVRGSDVNARDDCGYTALHLSAEHGYIEIMRLLIEYQAKINFSDKVEDEDLTHKVVCDEPLRMAVKNGHLEAARFLLENGANPNSRYFFGSEINLVAPQNTEFLELLLMYGAYPDARDRTGLTPLMRACRVPKAMQSVLTLISYGADVNARTDERNDFRTVLHFAVLSGNRELVGLLLKQGATPRCSPDDPSRSKPTPLDMAVLKGDLLLVEMLIEAGADVNNTTPVLGSALHVACADNIPNRFEIIQMLLENGANPNIVARSEDGLLLQSVLGEYISSNNADLQLNIIKLLLRHGAKVMLKTQYREPLGILSSLGPLSQDRVAFYTVLDAAQSFDLVMLKHSKSIPAGVKGVLVNAASQPLTLKQLTRFCLRDLLLPNLHRKVPLLEIPTTLQSYMMFDIS